MLWNDHVCGLVQLYWREFQCRCMFSDWLVNWSYVSQSVKMYITEENVKTTNQSQDWSKLCVTCEASVNRFFVRCGPVLMSLKMTLCSAKVQITEKNENTMKVRWGHSWEECLRKTKGIITILVKKKKTKGEQTKQKKKRYWTQRSKKECALITPSTQWTALLGRLNDSTGNEIKGCK